MPFCECWHRFSSHRHCLCLFTINPQTDFLVLFFRTRHFWWPLSAAASFFKLLSWRCCITSGDWVSLRSENRRHGDIHCLLHFSSCSFFAHLSMSSVIDQSSQCRLSSTVSAHALIDFIFSIYLYSVCLLHFALRQLHSLCPKICSTVWLLLFTVSIVSVPLANKL